MHVGHHRSWWFARQHPLEVTARQAVLALEKERPRQFQAHPHQAGTIGQDGAQGGDGLVQQCLPVRFGCVWLLRRLDRRQASEKQDIRAARMRLQQRAQVSQRLDEPAGPDQCPRR